MDGSSRHHPSIRTWGHCITDDSCACSGSLVDLIGIHVIFGAFICELIIPKDGPFTATLIEKVEDYVSVLFLPLYFAASGLRTHLSAINNGTAVLIRIMVLATACVGKVLGTFIVAKLWLVENHKAIALGLLTIWIGYWSCYVTRSAHTSCGFLPNLVSNQQDGLIDAACGVRSLH